MKDNKRNGALFTGDYRRDTVVSQYEKLAEASNSILNAVKQLFKKMIK